MRAVRVVAGAASAGAWTWPGSTRGDRLTHQVALALAPASLLGSRTCSATGPASPEDRVLGNRSGPASPEDGVLDNRFGPASSEDGVHGNRSGAASPEDGVLGNRSGPARRCSILQVPLRTCALRRQRWLIHSLAQHRRWGQVLF